MTYAGRKILVVGLARSGQAAVELLLERGAHVHAYDRDPARLASLDPRVEWTSGGALPDLEDFDFAVASPGVPIPPGARVVPEIDLAAAHLEAPLIGVTGTNGKSTVSVLIAEMLRASGLATEVGGNLGTPLCALVGRPAERVVAELSSFQLEHAQRLRASVAVLLNLAPDHLDRHGTLERYGAAKARLTELQQADDVVVWNADDAWARAAAERSAARSFPFSAERVLDCGVSIAQDRLVWIHAGTRRFEIGVDELSNACRSPRVNALAATAAAFAAGAGSAGVAATLRGFEGLPHRSRLVHEAGGVRWIDDSKATNPAAAAASAAAQPGPLVWLLGGRNKGLDFAPLRPVAARVRHVIVYGECRSELAAALAGATEVEEAAGLAEAVAAAARAARPGETVLLAPACASFDEFRDFEERGQRFAAWAREAGPARATS